MNSYLHIRSTTSASKRRSMGDKSMSRMCYDAVGHTRAASFRLSETSFDFEPKIFDVYESMLNFGIAGFLFG